MKTVKVRGLTIGRGIPLIIAPLMESDERTILEEAAVLTASPAQMCEWRLDAWDSFRDAQALRRLLSSLRQILGDMPLLVTLRTAEEGGMAQVTEEEYKDLTEEIIVSGYADLVDLENVHANPEMTAFARDHGVLTVLSSHDFQKTPDRATILSLLSEMAAKGCDIAKCACKSRKKSDVGRILSASKEASYRLQIPLITISMGREGLISRTSGEVYGSAMTFASVGKSSAPGQIEAGHLQNLMRGIHKIRQLDRPIFLTGFMGTGKSTVAQILSAYTGQVVCEMDHLIENEAGMTIKDIFAEEGEEGFRNRETRLLGEIGRERGVIVSTGGGIVTRAENIGILRRCGYVFWLKAGTKTLMKRLENSISVRPLLQGDDPAARVSSLLAEREEAYRAAAHFVIRTDEQTPEETALEIIETINRETD